ncbi:hypothetical protein [Microbacterium sp.]|uniref:hypothetical protein n=1 Tax=Microbacterium sp. TaxID=51671 RepID=UPI003C710ABA
MSTVKHRPAHRSVRVVRGTHAFAGLLLWLFFLVSVPLYLYQQNGAITVEGWLDMLRVEAEGGGPANLVAFLLLTAVVAALGVTMLIDLIRRGRRPFTSAGSPRGRLYLLHRWVGAVFAVTLVAYVAARLFSGAAPLALGWAWLVLLIVVDLVGLVVFIVWAVAATRRRGAKLRDGGTASGS